jgi:hypothetical protein
MKQKFVFKHNQIIAGQYCFPFTIKLPERDKNGKLWPSSVAFNSNDDQFRIGWRLQFGFNRSFKESPLEITRNLKIVFQPQPDENEHLLEKRKGVKVPECEAISQIYVKM